MRPLIFIAMHNLHPMTLNKTNVCLGSACVGNLDTRSWVGKYWGHYVTSGSWRAIKVLRLDFDVVSCFASATSCHANRITWLFHRAFTVLLKFILCQHTKLYFTKQPEPFTSISCMALKFYVFRRCWRGEA